MDLCLLCLELRHESVEFIKIDEIKLPDESIEEVIEKHLWPMESISSNAWLCRCCWQILYEFHKFYLRVEEAHEDLANMLDVETPFEKQLTANCCNTPTDQVLNRGIEEPHSIISLNDLPVDDLSQMRLVGEKETSLKTCEIQNHSTEFQEDNQITRNLFEIEEELSIKSQSQRTELPCDDQRNVMQSILDETSGTSKDFQQLAIFQSEIITNAEQSNDEKIISDDNEDNSKYLKDPLKRPLLLPEKIITLDTSESADVRDYCEEDNKDGSHASPIDSSQSENDNLDYELTSELSNDTESDTNSNETSLTSKKLNQNLGFYDKLPNNKRDEDDRIIAKNIELICEICLASSRTFHDLRCHYKNEHNQHGFVKCCHRTFKRRNLLADHMRWHLDPEYFKCQQCGKLFAERRCLDLHVTNVHENRGKCHVCDICGNSFSEICILRNHKITHLSEEEKKFPCTQCGKNFGAKHLLTNHIRAVHLRKYIKVCDICGKKFQVKIKFERHLLEHKGVPQPTVDCDICGFKSVDVTSLKRHKQAQHPEGGKMEYKCHLCPKISPSLRAHKVHVQYKHELGYTFKCTLCDKAFKRSHTLKEHMATHTQTDLYTCPHCPMTFKSNANMHKHRKNAHPVEWENARRKKFSGILPPTNQKPSTY